MPMNLDPDLTAAVRHLIDSGCHYRMEALAACYAPDLRIVMVSENGETLTFDYAQNLAFFQSLKDAGAAPLNTAVIFNHAEAHDGIGYVSATRRMDLGQGEKRIVFTLMLRHDGKRWQVFREHAVVTGAA
ncbi:hypothetical protein CK620_05315 [Vandammella animalimorsus]|uniref:Uncharacterized protein n=2 Tax=Vandammella animalimorsus TaxID=2029117 RepID=A0A2A2AC26_9BURK|nr:hypothetical protein CK620_05315 [Vandammella animalimorsus]